MTAPSASTSAWLLEWPSENRSEPRARASLAPMASSTWLGCAMPAVQADPVEQAMPLASSSISSASPSQPGNEKWALPGGQDLRDQVVPQRREPLGLVEPSRAGVLDRDREGPDRGSVQGAGTHVALLAAAVKDGDQVDAASEQQRADPQRPADLVGGDRERGSAALREVDRQLARRLDGVAVEGNLMLTGHGGQVGNRLHGPDLVVRPHDADQGDGLRVALDDLSQRLGASTAGIVQRQPADLGPLVLVQPAHAVEDGVMLDGRGEHAKAPGICRAARPEQALDREIVRLGSAAGEDHLAGPRAVSLRDLLPRLLDHPARPPTRVVQG